MNAHHVLSQHTVPSAYSISPFHISPPGRCCSTTGILQRQSSPGWVTDGCFSRGDLFWADPVQLVGVFMFWYKKHRAQLFMKMGCSTPVGLRTTSIALQIPLEMTDGLGTVFNSTLLWFVNIRNSFACLNRVLSLLLFLLDVSFGLSQLERKTCASGWES